VPYVIYEAPKGIVSIWLPDVATFQGNHAGDVGRILAILIHCIFWPIFFICLAGAKRSNLRFLKSVFFTMLGLILLMLYGCARNYAWFAHAGQAPF
jgi:hypothetical protein